MHLSAEPTDTRTDTKGDAQIFTTCARGKKLCDSAHLCARPDDPAGNEKSWRERLIEYNERPGNNPLGLYSAYQLFENRTYGGLVGTFGLENV